MNKMKQEDILKLIHMGFEPRIISAEFGIPLEQIEMYIAKQQITNKQQAQPSDKMKKIRNNYKSLYSKKSDPVKIKELQNGKSPKEASIISDFLERLDRAYGKDSKLSQREKREVSHDYLKEFIKYASIPLNIDELEQIHTYLFSDYLQRYYAYDLSAKTRRKYSNRAISIIESKIQEQVKYLTRNTEDINELMRISSKIPSSSKYSLTLESARSAIYSRLTELRQKQASSALTSTVSENMHQLTQVFNSEEPDIEQIKNLIESETQRRNNTTSNNKFSLSRNQHQRQVIMQLKRLLDAKAEQYPINNPDKTLEILHQIDPETDTLSQMRLITSNLSSQDREEDAIQFCHQYSNQRKSDGIRTELAQKVYQLIKGLISSQIGKIVLKQINLEGNQEHLPDDDFLKLLEEKMKSNTIKPEQITLGKNNDGTKTIKLSDIWYDKTLTPDTQR